MPRSQAVLAVILCLASSRGEAQSLRGLAERDGLRVGVMPVDQTWNTPQQKELVEREFNVVTVGTYWKRTRPAREAFDWAVTDAVVGWAREAELGVHLHPLVWATDEQNPDWLLASDPADAQAILEEHIAAAIGRYRGKAAVWDVVNEAVANDGSGGYRDSWWLRALGPEYIVAAFRLARAADPDAKLIYNDYALERDNAYQTGRWARVQEIVATLKAEGLIDGLGWQLHVTPEQALAADFALEERMAWVEEQGLANYVTELDVAIEPGDEALQSQAETYRKIAEIWLDRHNGGWFQTWGLYDKYTWLGADKRPLLFDESYAPKPAFAAVVEAFDRATTADFNGDGAVDGADFLEWQRGVGSQFNADDLRRWRKQSEAASTGGPQPDAQGAVPEPRRSLTGLFTSLVVTGRRCRAVPTVVDNHSADDGHSHARSRELVGR